MTPAAPGPQILVTKIAAPGARVGAVARPELLARLDGALAVPLTLVAAPAGFGKTTLLAQWAARAHARVAWLALDPSDGDPVTFARYLVASLRAAGIAAGESALALLEGPQPPPLTALLVQLLNDLAALDEEVAIIFDDYHVIAAAVHEALALALERLPPRAHLVIAGRGDPPLPLARLRARGRLLELRAGDLRFTAAEAGAFLRDTMGLPLADAEVARLDARTEGWAAALQLAALALRGQPDAATAVAAFAGTSRHLFDYLAEEVLDRLPTHLRDFLLRTSVLERLSAELCDAVTGLGAGEQRGGSQALLAQLEREGLFLLALDGERRWYRYHQLFAEALRERLRAVASPAEVAELYRRAAGAEASSEQAVAYLLAARLWDEATARIEAEGPALLALGHTGTVRRWVAALPLEARNGRPGLSVLHGLAVARDGAIAQGAAILTQAVERCRPEADDVWRATALTELAVLALIDGDLAAALPRIEAALALPAPPPIRSFGLMVAVGAYTIAGRRGRVATCADELFALLREGPDAHLAANVLGGALSLAVSLFDHLDALEELCRAGLREPGERASLARVGAEAGLAHIAWLRGRLDEAVTMAERARQTSSGLGTYAFIEPQMVSIAGIAAYASGDLERAAAHYERALRNDQQISLYDFARPGQLYALARVRLQQGRLDAARAVLDRMRAEPAKADLAPAALELLAGALALAEGDDVGAAALLRPLAAREDTVGMLAVFGSARPLLAHLALRAGRPIEAAAALAPLLDACARDRTPGRLLLEGPALGPLLRAAIAHGAQPVFAAETLAILEAQEARRKAQSIEGHPGEGATASRAGPHAPQGLVEPLSPRELEVLRLLAGGASNRAIAAALIVAPGTAKRHVSNLMGKLGAASRLEAVARARELGLL